MNLQLGSVLLDLREINPVRDLLHQLVEQMHHLGPAALQLLDDLHARDQALLAILEILNVGDLRVELDDLLLQEIVLLVLRIDPARVNDLAAQGKYHGGEHCRACGDEKLPPPDLAFLFAPGK